MSETPEDMSFEGELIKLLDAEPFTAFEIIVSSGDRFRVDDPHRVALGGNMVVIMDRKQGMCFFRKNQLVGVDATKAA